MPETTRALELAVAVLTREVQHIGEKLDTHISDTQVKSNAANLTTREYRDEIIKSSREYQETITTKINHIETKLEGYNDIKQQTVGAGKLLKFLYVLVGGIIVGTFELGLELIRGRH